MIINNPNYISMPEQVDYLTDKQTETDTTLDELDQAITDVGDTVAEHSTDIENIQEDIETLDGAVEQNTEDISTLTSEVEAVSGRGGYLIPHNFETDTPTETQLNNYALSQITNITTPEEIFNGTRVTNLYNNHTWILNNTQDTDPVVFEWVDLGQSLVSVADDNTLGVVKGSPSDFKCSVNNDGTLSVNGIGNALNGKQDKLTTTSVEDGTIDKSIGFDNLGNIVKGSAGGGSLYAYKCTLIPKSNSTFKLFEFQLLILTSDNNLLVTDITNFTTYITNNSTGYQSKMVLVNATSTSINQLKQPYDFGFDSSGNIYIFYKDIDFTNETIHNVYQSYIINSSNFDYRYSKIQIL